MKDILIAMSHDFSGNDKFCISFSLKKTTKMQKRSCVCVCGGGGLHHSLMSEEYNLKARGSLKHVPEF